MINLENVNFATYDKLKIILGIFFVNWAPVHFQLTTLHRNDTYAVPDVG